MKVHPSKDHVVLDITEGAPQELTLPAELGTGRIVSRGLNVASFFRIDDEVVYIKRATQPVTISTVGSAIVHQDDLVSTFERD